MKKLIKEWKNYLKEEHEAAPEAPAVEPEAGPKTREEIADMVGDALYDIDEEQRTNKIEKGGFILVSDVMAKTGLTEEEIASVTGDVADDDDREPGEHEYTLRTWTDYVTAIKVQEGGSSVS